MKCKFLITILITISNVGFSQNYLDDIALKTCECLNTVSDTAGIEEILGLCMIDAALPYKKQLKEDYNIDLNKIDTQGEELGRIIGIKMTTVCPNTLKKVVNRTNKNNANKISKTIFEGQIIAIEDNKFVEFSVEDKFGKIHRFYWFSFIESNIELSNNYKTLLEETVVITFFTQEFFDARVTEYRTFNIIQKLEKKEK